MVNIENKEITSEREVRTSSQLRFAPDSIITGLVGLLVLLFGLIAVVRGGFSGSMSEPVVTIFGFTHTTTLGLIEIGIGLCLLVSAAMYSRSSALFFGALLGIFGFVGAVQTDSFKESLALESEMGWIAVALGLLIVLAVFLLPRVGKNSTKVTHL